MKMNKKILIGGGIAAFIISAIAGVYIYTKKSIGKIAAAIDDTFDIGDNNNTIQYQFDLTKTNKNGSSCAKNVFIPKEEEGEEKRTIKMPKISYCCYDTVGVDRAMKNDIDELKERVEKLEQNLNCLNGNCNYNILFDDKHYNDYINTMDAFFGDDKK